MVVSFCVLGRALVVLGLVVVHSHGREEVLLLPLFGRGVVACVRGIFISGPSTKTNKFNV